MLNGVVTENVYGIVSTATFRLDTQGGHILWSGEVSLVIGEVLAVMLPRKLQMIF